MRESRMFVVDTENTNDYNFIKEYNLGKGDSVVLFLSENTKGIMADGCMKLFNHNARIITEPVKVIGKKSFDFQLVAFITEQAVIGKKKEIYIISNDCGFSYAISYISKKYNVKITQIKPEERNILEGLYESIDIRGLVSKNFTLIDEEVFKNVVTIIGKSKSLQELHSNLYKNYGQEGKALFKDIKVLWEEIKRAS